MEVLVCALDEGSKVLPVREDRGGAVSMAYGLLQDGQGLSC